MNISSDISILSSYDIYESKFQKCLRLIVNQNNVANWHGAGIWATWAISVSFS